MSDSFSIITSFYYTGNYGVIQFSYKMVGVCPCNIHMIILKVVFIKIQFNMMFFFLLPNLVQSQCSENWTVGLTPRKTLHHVLIHSSQFKC